MRLAFLIAFAALTGCTRSEKPAMPAAPPVPTVRVEVWHDTVCPWCRIGIHNLETATAQLGSKVKVDVVWHSYLLNADTPPQGTLLREHLGARYGEGRLDEMFARVTQFGAQYGVQFRWELVTVMPNTAASHALLDWAPAEKKQAYLDALHRAYFEEGKNIGDVEVLAAIARSAGLDEAGARAAITSPERLAAARASTDDATRRGITGVPFFVIAGQGYNGAQPPERLAAAIEAAAR